MASEPERAPLIRTQEELLRRMYTTEAPANACVRLLNATAEIGCAGEMPTALREVHLRSFFWALQSKSIAMSRNDERIDTNPSATKCITVRQQALRSCRPFCRGWAIVLNHRVYPRTTNYLRLLRDVGRHSMPTVNK